MRYESQASGYSFLNFCSHTYINNSDTDFRYLPGDFFVSHLKSHVSNLTRKMSNIVAIVGRPNVGKSTLYNRLTESRKAIVDDFSGVTRDRHYGIAEWTHHNFTVIDTGGYVANSEDVFEAAIREQVIIAIEEATVILFMVDVTTGITDLDDEIANLLRRGKKPVLVVVNKVDNHAQQSDAAVFYSLGLGELYTVS